MSGRTWLFFRQLGLRSTFDANANVNEEPALDRTENQRALRHGVTRARSLISGTPSAQTLATASRRVPAAREEPRGNRRDRTEGHTPEDTT